MSIQHTVSHSPFADTQEYQQTKANHSQFFEYMLIRFERTDNYQTNRILIWRTNQQMAYMVSNSAHLTGIFL